MEILHLIELGGTVLSRMQFMCLSSHLQFALCAKF